MFTKIALIAAAVPFTSMVLSAAMADDRPVLPLPSHYGK